MTQLTAHRVHTDEALAVYLEPHAEGRRVLLLGEAEGELGTRLHRVAERLEIIDPAARVPSDGEVPELPFRSRSFDLIVVVDAAILPEPRAEAVRELRRVMTDDGVLALAGSLPAQENKRRRGAPQASLDRLLAAEFRHVQVIGQAPLSGYSFGGQDAPRDEDFSVDSSLVRGLRERAQRTIAFGSDLRLRLETRLWVQVPASETDARAPERAAAPSPELIQELRRAEEEVRAAHHRETELLRELEELRRSQQQAERVLERSKAIERKLVEIEGDYDDAVARVRYLESEQVERDRAGERERAQLEQSQKEAVALRKAAAESEAKRLQAEQEREGARADLTALGEENAGLEARLVTVGEELRALASDKKHQEVVAKDLLEELRSRERAEHVAVEHDARVTELEAERERAVRRALEAELARESAAMRADELRAQIAQLEEGSRKQDSDETRGELIGLRMRLHEAESALTQYSATERRRSFVDGGELERARDRIDELEDALDRVQGRMEDADRVVELEAELDRLDHRVQELTRDLEEADRFAEASAEDSDRIDALEAELETARRRMDQLEDELRATQDELRAARTDVESVAVENSARLELAQRREHEARTERDETRTALTEARAILAQLAGEGISMPPSLQPLEEQLRAALSEREARLAQAERTLFEQAQRIQQLEEGRGG
jgi:DNA repair exonuclease SbcCD ATPase subunit